MKNEGFESLHEQMKESEVTKYIGKFEYKIECTYLFDTDTIPYELIFIRQKGKETLTEETIKNKISEGISSAVNKVSEERENYYKKNRNYIDYVVDQCNTFRYFTFLWIKKSKRIFFIHQLTKDIWFKNAKFPLNLFGFLFEPVHLWLTRDDFTITVSDSTKSDLLKLGFKNEKITILPEGINFLAWKKEDFLEKEKNPTFIYVGRFVHYKGIDDSIIAFGKLKEKYPNSKLWVVGKKNDKYIKESLIPIMNRYNLSYGNSFDDKDITFWGFVSDDEKYNLMSRSHALIFPSTREGWGLTVTESAVVGTPSIVYNSPGLVDAVNHGEAGYLCNINTPETIYSNMLKILENREAYETMRSLAYSFSKQFHWDNTSQSFENFLTFIKK